MRRLLGKLRRWMLMREPPDWTGTPLLLHLRQVERAASPSQGAACCLRCRTVNTRPTGECAQCAGMVCTVLRGERECGAPKLPDQPSCPRAECRAAAEQRPRARVMPIRGRTR
jgi:hypothetical protein